MTWQEYIQSVMYPGPETIQDTLCPICGSCDLGWISIEELDAAYYGCRNCIRIKETFTTA